MRFQGASIMQNSKISVQDICSIAIMTAITAVMAQISIPMPMGVPLTMQTFAVTLSGIVLGARRGAISMIIYVLLGAVGVPVLAGFSGGFQHFIGPTGGFLLSFPVMAYLIGVGTKLRKQKGMFLLFLIFGTAANYAVGVLMFCILMKASFWTGFTACVLPFLPTAAVKAAAASVLGLKLQVRLGEVMQWT